MGVLLALLLAFVFSGCVLGEGDPACPPTIVDCACTEKDGNFYTIQINTTTISISDEDTGLDRCIADGDPLALCEDRNCIIIPNDNFNILFRMGKKMSPSNYLRADDLDLENETSTNTSNNTDSKAGSGPSEDMTSSFYPIELTYPRMIHGEEDHQLVKRSNQFDSDGFIPPPADSDRESLQSSQGRHFGDMRYRQRDPGFIKRPTDSEFGNRKYSNNGTDPFGNDTYQRPDSFRPLPNSEFGDATYKKKDPDFEDVKITNNGRSGNTSMFSDDSPPMEPQKSKLFNRQYSPFNIQHSNSNSDPLYWGGAYGYACKVPQLKNSEITCWKWPNWQTCKQTCIYGHGIASQQGTVRSTTYTCRNTENQWQPQKMTDCQPYLNCKVRLRSPGDLKCVEPTNRPAYCDIACEEYDTHSAQKVRVTCDETMGGMRLPFCATLDNSFMNHVRAPST